VRSPPSRPPASAWHAAYACCPLSRRVRCVALAPARRQKPAYVMSYEMIAVASEYKSAGNSVRHANACSKACQAVRVGGMCYRVPQ